MSTTGHDQPPAWVRWGAVCLALCAGCVGVARGKPGDSEPPDSGIDSRSTDSTPDSTDTDTGSGADTWQPGDTSPRGGDRSLADADLVIQGSVDQGLSTYLSFGTDIDGDGEPEMIVGTVSGSGGYDTGGGGGYPLENSVFVVPPQRLAGTVSVEDASICEHKAGGQAMVLPDLDGDGFPEIATGEGYPVGASIFAGVGCPDSPIAEIGCGSGDCPVVVLGAGPVLDSERSALLTWTALDDGERRAYVVDAAATGVVDLEAESISISDSSSTHFVGCAGLLRDLDADGVADVLVEGGVGAAYVFHGPILGAADLADADAVINGIGGGQICAHALTADDLSGDGVDDLALGNSEAGGSLQPGLVRLFWGPLVGDRAESSADAQITGEGEYSSAGADVSAVGDVDGDGSRDLLVGAPDEDLAEANAGAGYLVSGPFLGNSSLSDAAARFTGDVHDGKAGGTVGGNDLNADGAVDFMIGSPQGGAQSPTGGALYVFWGTPE